MKKCIFDRINIEQVEDSPLLRQIGEQVNSHRAALLATMTEEQRQLFNSYDDACLNEGTARVNSALMAACGCSVCI